MKAEIVKLAKKLNIKQEKALELVKAEYEKFKKKNPKLSADEAKMECVKIVWRNQKAASRSSAIEYRGMIWGASDIADLESYKRRIDTKEAEEKYKLVIDGVKAKIGEGNFRKAVTDRIIDADGHLLRSDNKNKFRSNGLLKKTVVGMCRPTEGTKGPRLFVLNLWDDQAKLEIPRWTPVKFSALDKTDVKEKNKYVLNGSVSTIFEEIKATIPNVFKQRELFRQLGHVQDIDVVDEWFAGMNDEKLRQFVNSNNVVVTEAEIERYMEYRDGRRFAMLDDFDRPTNDATIDSIQAELPEDIREEIDIEAGSRVLVIGIPVANTYNVETKDNTGIRRLALKLYGIFEVDDPEGVEEAPEEAPVEEPEEETKEEVKETEDEDDFFGD